MADLEGSCFSIYLTYYLPLMGYIRQHADTFACELARALIRPHIRIYTHAHTHTHFSSYGRYDWFIRMRKLAAMSKPKVRFAPGAQMNGTRQLRVHTAN